MMTDSSVAVRQLPFGYSELHQPLFFTIEAISRAKDVDDNTICTFMDYCFQVETSGN